MDADEGLRLLNELLSVEDDVPSETDENTDSDDGVVSVTPTLDVETVVKSIAERFHQHYSSDESDNESLDGSIDDTNDPDYIPSTDKSLIAQSSFLDTTIEEDNAISDSPSSNQNETQLSTSNSLQPKVPQTQPSTSNSQQPEVPQTQPSTSNSLQPEVLQTQPSTSNSQQPEVPQTQPSTSNSLQPEVLQTQPSTSNSLQPEVQQPRKRQRNPNQWKRNVKKRKIAKGEEYITKSGTIKPARTTGADCRCRMKCFGRIDENQRAIILQEFNNLQSSLLQDAYLAGCVNSTIPKRKRSKNGARETGKGSRKWTYEYSVKPETIPVKICFKAFMSLHGIGLTRAKRIRTPGITLPPSDKRGHHSNHYRISEEIRDKVKAHISSFQKRESHYSRQNNLQRRYLDERLNVKRMWLLYLQENEPAQRLLYRTNKMAMKPIVKYKYYMHIFNNSFNLTFGQPRSDTCPICDKYDMQIKAEDDVLKRKHIEEQRDMHQMRANSGYQTLNWYMDKSKTDPSLEVYTFDFQQNLPAPSLTAGDMFYSRMLWTYNFGLHDTKTGDGIMHMWSEAEAGRGSSEVCSCLRETIIKRHETHKGDHLILFSDGCAGQNKNKAVMNFLFELTKEGVYKSIQHLFLFRGHTFLPNDRDFSHIEKRKKVERVMKPTDWEGIVKDSRLSQPFEVVFLDHKMFFDYKALADAKLKTNFKAANGESLRFKDVMWFSYGESPEMNDLMDIEISKQHAEEVWCRYTHNRMEQWKKINPRKRFRMNQTPSELKRKYAQPVGIKAAKKKDLLSLAAKDLVNQETKIFYESLPVVKDKEAIDSDDDNDDYVN